MHATGPQISWRDVYIIEYIGALVAHPVIYNMRLSTPTSVQTLLLVLIMTHFIKQRAEDSLRPSLLQCNDACAKHLQE